MIAAIYARKSTEQAVSDDQKSIARQVEHARAYAVRKGWAVADQHVYTDDGISGAEFARRPGFLRLMNALKPRPSFDVLVMSEESRLGREAIETAYALKQLVQAGVRVFFYMEDRERTLDSPTDKIMMSLTAFADELEREKARQRTTDAMQRKAKAGHVTGGRVFGYDNVEILGAEGRRSHVERRIRPAEAEIVRQIFAMCADGQGVKTIARTLNDRGAASPRAQQGRPSGWSPSSVREVLYRELYRGLIVYNKTKKRDQWGQKRVADRPEADWLRIEAPDLRIITDAAWEGAHGRLAASAQTYLRSTGGKLWGRPIAGTAAKYLLTGLMRCGCCGGNLLVKSGTHGKRRAHRYGCSSYHLRGRAICSNGHELPLASVHEVVLDAIQDEVLNPGVMQEAVRQAVAQMTAGPAAEEDLQLLRQELREVERELRNLTAALAAGGDMLALVEAMKSREGRRNALEQQIAAASSTKVTDPRRLEQQLYARLGEWRDLLTKQTQIARQILQKLLQDKILCTPKTADGQPQYELRFRIGFERLFQGILPTSEALAVCSRGLASPPGTATAWTREIVRTTAAA
jgi:site-specific DNA recombinase